MKRENPKTNSETARKKRTLREDWKVMRRGIRIALDLCPQFLAWDAARSVTDILPTYFSLYMTARLVNELSGECRQRELFLLAGIVILGLFALRIVSRAVHVRYNIWMDLIVREEEIYMFDKQHGLQYEHLENPEVTLLREKIFAAMNADGSGVMALFWDFGGLVGNLADMAVSASLTFSIFRMAAGRELTGFLAFVNSPYCSVLLGGLLLVHILLTIRFARELMKKNMQAISGLAESNMLLQILFKSHGEDITVFNLKKILIKEHERRIKEPWMVETDKLRVQYTVIRVLQGLIPELAVFLVTAAKAFLGVFGIGNFILYRGTVKRFVDAVTNFARDLTRLRENNEYLLQLYEFLDLPDDMYHGTLAVEKRDDIDYEIEFRDVSFRYPGTENWVLRHVDMKFRIGDKLAIVGENGSGKTTFIKLLCRLYDPTEGRILLNGIDITRYRYQEYLSLFSVVFQDYKLFQFSLADNVACSPDCDQDKVRSCLIRAGFGDRLAQLEKGIHTPLGRDYENDGIDLSGGEEQKVALARALYKDGPFVVLDEPTAALDPLAEAAVYEDFRKIVEHKTAVFISHRLSSCRFCDDIIVFDRGCLIQRGNHEQLAAREGKYRQLWNAQAKYYR